MAKLAVALLAAGACLLLMREAARIGFSRLLTRYALTVNSLTAAEHAVQITPADPEAHRARGLVLNRLLRPVEAEASLEVAAGLRAGHEDLWIELGNTREELGDNDGALAAFNQAVRSAPYYAHTHWQRGNLLLRMGRYEEAFADLRQASASNRKYLPNLIDLVWSLTAGDAGQTESLLQISNDNDRFAFTRFLAQRGKGKDVVEQVRLLATPLSPENMQELTRLLFAAPDYSGPYDLWPAVQQLEQIINSGFEDPLLLSRSPLGWVISPNQKPKLAVDVSEKFRGERSLQITFGGEWQAGTTLLSQMVPVRAGVAYRVSFAVKTTELVTGGPLRIVLTGARNDRILAKSDPFPPSTGAWETMRVEFTSPSEAVFIGLARDDCAASPCPVFGVAWLDEFSLERL